MSATGCIYEHSAGCFNVQVGVCLSLAFLSTSCKLARMFSRHFLYAQYLSTCGCIRTRLRGCGLPRYLGTCPTYFSRLLCLPNRARPQVLVGAWARALALEPHAIRNNQAGIAFCKTPRRILPPSTLDSRHRRRVLLSHAHQRQNHSPIWFRLDRLCGGSCSHIAVFSER